ncbi:hypothetical protein ZWY2020_051629 [Hordeum vulgare]|nr:hypothetical protein ZWY2020_051629 [Hordeum vulgare]
MAALRSPSSPGSVGRGDITMEGAEALRSPSAPSSMSSSSSRATSRIQRPERMDMPIFLCSPCQVEADRRVSCKSKNHICPFYMCNKNGVKCFFLWVDALAKTMMNELLEQHETRLPILPRTAAAIARAPEEETEGGGCNDREVDVELRRLNQKIWKLEDPAEIPIFNYIWSFVGILIALGVILKLYGKA